MLILASGSPRRRELLQQIGVEFKVVTSAIDETPLPQESATAYVARMAQEKALAVAHLQPQHTILAADTIVVLHDKILIKPANREDAENILQQLSGRTHQVLTAVCLLSSEHMLQHTESTQVTFKTLTAAQITAYVATQEPMDKAGAYGIQGKGAVLVEKINGCYSNVVGLPLAKTAELLHSFNIPIWH